jgi:hypothetical protein
VSNGNAQAPPALVGRMPMVGLRAANASAGARGRATCYPIVVVARDDVEYGRATALISLQLALDDKASVHDTPPRSRRFR